MLWAGSRKRLVCRTLSALTDAVLLPGIRNFLATFWRNTSTPFILSGASLSIEAGLSLFTRISLKILQRVQCTYRQKNPSLQVTWWTCIDWLPTRVSVTKTSPTSCSGRYICNLTYTENVHNIERQNNDETCMSIICSDVDWHTGRSGLAYQNNITRLRLHRHLVTYFTYIPWTRKMCHFIFDYNSCIS